MLKYKNFIITGAAAMVAITAAVIVYFTAFYVSPEEQVRQTLTEYTQCIGNLDMEKMIEMHHEDFDYSPMGGKENVKKMAKAIKAMKKILNGNMKPSEVVKLAAEMEGRTVTDAEMAQVKKLDGTPEGDRIVKDIALKVRPVYEVMSKQIKRGMDNCKINDIKVNGNVATAVIETPIPDTDKIEKADIELVKVDGKWLIKKFEAKN
jgi:hypothetical protein